MGMENPWKKGNIFYFVFIIKLSSCCINFPGKEILWPIKYEHILKISLSQWNTCTLLVFTGATEISRYTELLSQKACSSTKQCYLRCVSLNWKILWCIYFLHGDFYYLFSKFNKLFFVYKITQNSLSLVNLISRKFLISCGIFFLVFIDSFFFFSLMKTKLRDECHVCLCMCVQNWRKNSILPLLFFSPIFLFLNIERECDPVLWAEWQTGISLIRIIIIIENESQFFISSHNVQNTFLMYTHTSMHTHTHKMEQAWNVSYIIFFILSFPAFLFITERDSRTV